MLLIKKCLINRCYLKDIANLKIIDSHSSRVISSFKPNSNYSINRRYFGSSDKQSKDDFKQNKSNGKEIEPPEEFYDEDIESEKEFLDVASSLVQTNSLKHIASVKPLPWEYFEPEVESLDFNSKEQKFNILDGDIPVKDYDDHRLEKEFSDLDMSGLDYDEDDYEQTDKKDNMSSLTKLFIQDDIKDSFDDFNNGSIVTPKELNFTNPNMDFGLEDEDDKKLDFNNEETEEDEDDALDSFIPNTDPIKFANDEQYLRACPGKRQRHGTSNVFNCHKIDLEIINPFNIDQLQRFISEDSEILGKKDTGLCSKCQRKVAKTIKHSRNLGILPHIGEFKRLDARPLKRHDHFHDTSDNSEIVESKTIL